MTPLTTVAALDAGPGRPALDRLAMTIETYALMAPAHRTSQAELVLHQSCAQRGSSFLPGPIGV